MAELLPRFHRAFQALEDEQKVAKAILEAGEAPADANGRVLRRSADGHNWERRRPLPLISRGVPGTQPGTDPLQALIEKENRERRR